MSSFQLHRSCYSESIRMQCCSLEDAAPSSNDLGRHIAAALSSEPPTSDSSPRSFVSCDVDSSRAGRTVSHALQDHRERTLRRAAVRLGCWSGCTMRHTPSARIESGLLGALALRRARPPSCALALDQAVELVLQPTEWSDAMPPGDRM
jgi:hypothetical protein